VNGCPGAAATESANGAPQATAARSVAVKPRRPPGASPRSESGPQVIVSGGPTEHAGVASAAVAPPTNAVPDGPASRKYCQADVPVFASAKSYRPPRAVYVAAPPSPAAA
jgi:hypothetical protein